MDSTIDAQDQESLAITAISVASATGPITLMIPNHNLTNGEWIYLTGMQFLVESTSTPGTTTLNNEIYQVQYVDNNNIILALWDIPTQVLYTNFSGDITAGATYIGGGVIALFPKVYIQTKDFNPAKQVGMNVKTSYVDFLFDTTSSAIMNIIMRMNATDTDQGNLQIGNYNVETCNNKTGYITGIDLTNTNFAIITSINHGLLNGADILFSGIQGTTQLNGGEYIVTFISTNTFSIPVVTAGLSAYISMGYWTQVKEQYFTLGSQYTWHRFYSTSFGQYLSLIITNNNDQMSQLQTHQQAFVLNAMKIYYLPGGRNIFGV
jgi:hypothetical protein